MILLLETCGNPTKSPMITARKYAVSVTRIVTPISAAMALKMTDIRWLVTIWRAMNSAIRMATINHQGHSAHTLEGWRNTRLARRIGYVG